MAYTLSQSNGQFNSLKYNTLFQNPHQMKVPSLSEETKTRMYEAYEGSRRPKMNAPVNGKRSILDRTLDGLMVFNYTLAGGINNVIDGDKSTTFIGGVGDGLKASNPFGKGYQQGEVTFSKVLDTAGWQPESGFGKFLRGTAGFALDVALDPTTYIGGLGLAIKGTGVVGKTAKALDDVAKTLPAELLNSSGKLTKMTDEVATHILKNNPDKAKAIASLSDEDFTGLISDFTRNYNKSLGIREAGEITFGLKNAPFGEWASRKLGMKRGAVTIAKSNKGLMQVGKYSGMSHVYGATRNFLFGTKMIQKISKTARYNQFAKANPIELFDAVGYLKTVKGQQQSIRRAKQMAVQGSEALAKFSPSVQKMIIQLQEDPANWKVIEGLYDEAEVKTMDEFREAYSKELDEAISKRGMYEDTYEAIKTSDDVRVADYSKQIESELRANSEIKQQIGELDYNITWLKAERDQRLGNLKSAKITSEMDIDLRRTQMDDINRQYDETISEFASRKADVEQSIKDASEYLGKERSLEVSAHGFDLVKATPEMMEEEMSTLASQYEKAMASIDEAVETRKVSFAEGQQARDDLALELEAEAKRIYSREYYQAKKSTNLGRELREQEAALNNTIKAIDELKSKGASGYSKAETDEINNLITSLEGQRDTIRKQINDISSTTRIHNTINNLKREENVLQELSKKSFGTTPTRFDGMSDAQIQEEFKTSLRELLIEDADNATMMNLANKFALNTEDMNDFRAIVGNAYDTREIVFANELRDMLSELLLGKPGKLFPPKDVTINMARFIMTDKSDTSTLMKYFTSDNNFYNRKLTGEQAGRVIEKIKVAGYVPVMREALVDNYSMMSGMSSRFYKQLAQSLGYRKFADVRSEMDALQDVIKRQQDTIDDAVKVAKNPSTMNLTPEGVIDEIANITMLSKEDIMTRMGMVKPVAQYTSRVRDMERVDALIQAEMAKGVPDVESINSNRHMMEMMKEKHELYLKEKEMLDSTPIAKYELNDEFIQSVEESIHRMHPELEKAYNRLYELKGKERVRDREIRYFFSLDDVSQEQYLRYAEEDKRFGEFVQGMFNKEVERVRQVALDEGSSNGKIGARELEAEMGASIHHSYDDIVENIPPGSLKNLYYSFMFNNVVRDMPTALKREVDTIKETQRKLTQGVDGVTTGATPVSRNSLLDATEEGSKRFLREVLRGNVKKLDEASAIRFIDESLAVKGRGMDKRTKEYKDIKQQADRMRRAISTRSQLVEAISKGESVFQKIDEGSVVKLFESFGMERLKRISKTNNIMWEMSKVPVKDGGGFAVMNRSVDDIHITAKNSVDDAFKDLDEAKKVGDAKLVEVAENVLARTVEEFEEAQVLKALFDFNAQKEGNKLHGLLGQAIKSVGRELGETKGKADEIRKGFVDTIIGTKDKPNKAVIEKTRDVEMVLPYMVQKLHPGKMFDDLSDGQKYSLLRKTLGVVEKDLGGSAPFSIKELETKLNTRLIDTQKERELTHSYERFISKAEEGTHIVFKDEEGKQITGRLVESDSLGDTYTKGASVKIEAIKQNGDGAISSEIFDVPYENVLRTRNSPVSEIFNTVDNAIERQLLETQANLSKMVDDLEAGKHLDEAKALKPEVEKLSNEIDALYKRRTDSINSYYSKSGELEAVQKEIQTRMAQINQGMEQTLGKQLALNAERQSLKADAQLARFEEGDPFAIAVPGTKEWDEAREYIIKNDEEISKLVSEVTEESPKKVQRQLEQLIEQRMLGFAKGDGFKLFQDKVELLKHSQKLSDEVGTKMQELSKFQEDLLERESLDGAMKVIPDARANDLAGLQKEVDGLNKTIADIDGQMAKYDEQIQKSIDGIGTEMEVLKRKRVAKANEMKAIWEKNEASSSLSTKNLATLEADMHKLNDDITKLEDVLASDEALETLLATKLGKEGMDAVKRKSDGLNTWKYAIEDADLDENVKKWAVWMHEEMRRIGVKEVQAGKLNKGAFEEMINSYFPRVLSEDGEKFFAENQELLDKIRPLTSDYGFGTKFNNHGMKRVDELRNKSIYEVNDYFKDEYGVRLFEEDLARAYVGRMTKHAELMYDDHYTKTMMDVFGYEIAPNLAIREGYEAVANMGHIRQYIRELVDMQVKMEVSRGGEVGSDLMAKFEQQAIEQLRLKPEQLDQYKFPMVKLEGETLEALQKSGLARQMNKNIVEEANMARQMTIDRDNSKTLELFDKFTTWIKAMQTAVMPAFHARNFMSNMFQNWLAVGSDAFSPNMIKDSWKVSMAMGNREKLRALKPLNPIDPNKPVLHWEKIYDEAIIHGVVDEGFFAKDFDGHATSSGLLGGGKLDPTSTDNFAPIKAGFHVGSIIENQGRLAQFATHLKHGKSVEEASELVKKYLFDYSDLTLFEKRYMKRIFPYYTWLRKNSVLQVRELIEQPNKYNLVGKYMKSMENSADPNNEIEDQYISDYARDWMVTPFTMTKKQTNAEGVESETQEPILFSPNLPFMDLARLPDPFNIFESIQSFFSQTSPVMKTPLESIMNYNTHFDSKIVEEGDNPLTKNLNHALSNLAWYNAVKGMANSDTPVDFGLSVANSTVGIKMSSYDYDANKRSTVEAAWEEFYDKSMMYYLKNGQSMLTDAMAWEVKSNLSKSIIKLAGIPESAGEYSGTLAPISSETYNSLSDEDKKMYEAPSMGEAGFYHKRAVELSQQAFEEAGVIKKFAWTLLDAVDVPYKNQVQTVRVNEVIDGDTINVSVDGVNTSVRFLLVDTPESKGAYEDNPMAFGKEAYEYTKQLALGKDAKIYFDGYDSYGRMLGFVEVGNTSINEGLLREGLGKVRYLYDRDNGNADVQNYRGLEQQAVNQNKGVWSIPGYAEQGDTDFAGGRSSR